MSERKEPSIKSALWAGVLAIVDKLPKETGNTARSIGKFTQDGASSSVHATYEIEQPDGSSKVYTLTLTVEESRDDHDGRWGPGGRRDQDDLTKRVVVDNVHYLIGDGKGSFQGFGGRRVDIEFFDGRKVTTTDLWHQGTVPPKWRHRFPNNARFVQREIDFTALSPTSSES
ncbi:hypothetical protein [Microtetraspora niveoalba]|uniref:hypothetical protein n=1 Tax=Microtetraspora niveoalba TaxID=46175 RepID=UPI0008297F60|nr:hypothetical protein [Microtetraspora niveoalba]